MFNQLDDAVYVAVGITEKLEQLNGDRRRWRQTFDPIEVAMYCNQVGMLMACAGWPNDNLEKR